MPYQLAVKEMLLDHNDVDDLGVLEGEEAKATRASSDAVAHDCAFGDFAELSEVILE